ncbi:MAG TPA: hypothetical protein DCR44_00100 [Acholeplasmatales bacterium]|nr:MAG: hypothetical protein A2Y16_02805 [Tenericutes bacterium GWF2_57_13]HAQ55805.1 hypothetical protein [Acholeplasmatales bacterium]
MKLLLHVCCAPCSVMVVKTIRAADVDVTAYWYNPNIHPYTEYVARRDAFKSYSETIGLPVVWNDFYGLRPFVERAMADPANRCAGCYEERLRKTAEEAKQGGYDAFSTTLLISPYQKHERLIEVADRIAREVGVPFYYVDFRPFFREGQRIARTLPIYMQKYCGCIFSEEERYLARQAKKTP